MMRIRLILLTLLVGAAEAFGASTASASIAHWQVMTPANTIPGYPYGALHGVSCPSTGTCFAVGEEPDRPDDDTPEPPLVEELSSGEWHVQVAPGATSTSLDSLEAVSCVSATACVAVGDSYHPNSQVWSALAESWNGKKWTVLSTSVIPTSYNGVDVTAVKCFAATRCLAVGSWQSARYVSVPLALTWNGKKWSRAQVPLPSGQGAGALQSVSCTSPSNCIAVGATGGRYKLPGLPLVEQWNGRSWRASSPATDRRSPVVLNGISCFSANRCQAVGATENDGFPVTPLAFAWNGHGWQPSPAPNIRGNHRGGLDAVSCPSPSICLGVGYSMQSESSFGSETLADMWISQHWDLQLMPSSDPDLLDSLQAISCTSPTWCVAVGDAFDGGGDFATVAESFS